MNYDKSNIFAKILRGEIPNDTIHEDEETLSFDDLYPKRKVHGLVIPKSAYVDFTDFSNNASDAEIVAFVKGVAATAKKLGVDKAGYRVVINVGSDGGQEVPHLHAHVLGGEPVGKLVNENIESTECCGGSANTTTCCQSSSQPAGETGGPYGPEPTRFGDWEKNGRVSDF